MRLPDWETRLWSEVTKSDPFEWGKRDCFTFVADCVQAVTGVPIVCDLRETYDNAEDAAAIVERHGGVLTFGQILLGGRFKETDKPEKGDALCLRIPAVGLIGGVHLGGKRSGLLAEGRENAIIAFDLDIVAAWKVE